MLPSEPVYRQPTSEAPTPDVHSGSCSECGPVRDTNEDLVYAAPQQNYFMVLDGVGGHAGGAEASQIVLRQMQRALDELPKTKLDAQALETALAGGIANASAEMQQLAAGNVALEHMGTVFALALVHEQRLWYSHVGDCRVYLFRNQKADQVTVDETFVQLMADIGVLPSEDVQHHPMRNVILNSVGREQPQHRPHIHSVDLQPGDRIVLTSDGVTDYLEAPELEWILATLEDPQRAAETIVKRAIDGGSRDNVSCVVVSYGMNAARQRDQLRRELTQVHELLQDGVALDPEVVAQLRLVASDIATAIDQEQPPEKWQPLGERLSETMLDFETHHPRLTTAVGNLAESLSRWGI